MGLKKEEENRLGLKKEEENKLGLKKEEENRLGLKKKKMELKPNKFEYYRLWLYHRSRSFVTLK